MFSFKFKLSINLPERNEITQALFQSFRYAKLSLNKIAQS